MTEDHPAAAAGTVSIAVPVAVLSLLGIAFAWMAMVILDPRADDGFASMFALFGVPMIVAAIVIQLFGDRVTSAGKANLRGGFLWWVLLVLPAGVLSTLFVAVPAHDDYFIADDGPWSLLWMPLLVYLGILMGALLWFFFVLPLTWFARGVVAAVRGRQPWRTLIAPLALLSLGAVVLVGGLSISADLPGRAGWGSVIGALLGIPGGYEVKWPMGLWIVRILVLGVILLCCSGPFRTWLRRRRDA